MTKVKKVKEGCSECGAEGKDKDKERWVKVASILKDVHYPTKETFEGAVNSFVASKLSLEEIEGLAVTLRPEYQGSKDTYIQSQVRKVGIY